MLDRALGGLTFASCPAPGRVPCTPNRRPVNMGGEWRPCLSDGTKPWDSPWCFVNAAFHPGAPAVSLAPLPPALVGTSPGRCCSGSHRPWPESPGE